MTAFDRLCPALQYHVANTLGWQDLRPVQQLTIDALLDGHNAVVLAPTAGGKTEAAFFPLLSEMDRHDWAPVSVLYLSPIKALLNNQDSRIQHYAALLGRRAFTWHGDVGPTARKRFLRDPCDILLTTPESVEAMLMSSRVPARALFAGLQAVIIDEVHAFADDDRGAHLASLLERLVAYAQRDICRIGLSATVGNPATILSWLAGSSKRQGQVVDPGGNRQPPHLTLDWVGDLDNAARVIDQLHRGRKRLVFVDSRRKVEQLGQRLDRQACETYLIHGSLAAAQRQFSERMFAEGTQCVIVATSAMELGIDIGDLDHVLQIDGPGSVASFLQRMGRTGRRPGTQANCTFLCTASAGLLEAAAIIQLFREGYVEPVDPHPAASHIYAHQLMALSLQQGGVAISDVDAWLGKARAFVDLTQDTRDAILQHMLAQNILASQAGRLWLGPDGERLYGRRNFAELYAVFSTPRIITVRWGGRDLGSVDGQFLATLQDAQGQSAFSLGGRPWKVLSIDWSRGICAVEPAQYAPAARWSGRPQFLSYALCQAMRRVLIGQEHDPAWSQRAAASIQTMRDEHPFLHDHPAPLTELPNEGIRWWTFAGGRANTLLARMLEAALGGRCVVRNTSIDLLEEAGKSMLVVRQLLRQWHQDDRPHAADLIACAGSAQKERISKFEPCLPEHLRQQLWSRSGLDQQGAKATLTLMETK